MTKLVLVALLVASCTSTKPLFPTNTQQEKECKQAYTEGKISYSKYKECIESEHTP